jgi:hypothetical protein
VTEKKVNEIKKPTPAELVAEYVQLRDLRKAADERYAAWVKENYTLRMDAIELALLETLNALGSDSIASPAGTAYKKLSASVTIADAREFRRHVIGIEGWDLIDWRANKTTVQDLVKGGAEVPPGVNYSTRYTIGIRRK